MSIDTVLEGLGYLVSHPQLLLHGAMNAARRELTVPMALLRWAIDQRPRGKGPENIELFDADPALGLRLTIDLYGTKLTVSSQVTIEWIEFADDALKVALQVSGLAVDAPPGSPVFMMLQSLDLSKPAALMKMMPSRHTALVSAEDDRFVLDLMQIKALARNAILRRALAALSFLRVTGTRAEGDALALAISVSLGAIPSAVRRAVSLQPDAG